MAYGDFSLADLEKKFGIENQLRSLFEHVEAIEPSHFLKEALQNARELPVRSEKAKSETIVFPILIELRNRNDKYFTIYSGDNLNADENQGLKGECDFILARDTGTFDINYPIIQIVEAKRNDLEVGVPQCAAQLVGARKFNENKGVMLENLYGCVTTGDEWLFMKLSNQELSIDTRKYYLVEIVTLLAVFQQIIDYYKTLIK
ncbi:MAG: hypothetical protein H7Y04_07390 [Verrucomicrobia bacterium]|nr:hypothetical protein [Cytophagales bacterium]